jgi:hypothetical protein
MKQFLVFILSISLVSISCEEDSFIGESSCEYTAEFAEEYASIAQYLNAVSASTIDIDPYLTERCLEGLFAIYTSNTSQSNNFFQILDDSLSMYSLNSFNLNLYVDSIQTQLLLETGYSSNAVFDSLIDLYGITLGDYQETWTSINFDISINENLNTIALSKVLRNLPFVSSSYLDLSPSYTFETIFITFGYYIRSTVFDDQLDEVQLYVYTAPCFTPMPPPTITHSFEIDENCDVEFVNVNPWD